MIQMNAKEVVNLLKNCSFHNMKDMNDLFFEGVSIDTRSLTPGNLFAAISGNRVDGHSFVSEARNKGAAFAVVEHQVDDPLPQFVVKNVIAELGVLANAWRQRFKIPIIAVTGSNGKTTLKNMIAAIMLENCGGKEEKVLATKGTLNNHIGLPLTLFRLGQEHHYAVIEMGMNHFGEIDYLSRLTNPDVSIITNAGVAHLEGVGDIAGVALAKSEIFNGLNHAGTAILNRDDAYYEFWKEKVKNRKIITFGRHTDADIKATINRSSPHPEITMMTPKGSFTINLPLLGEHNILNTSAATATALAIDIDLDSIKLGLEKIKPAPGRLELHTLANGVNIIDDTYNANPFSLQAAVKTLANFRGVKVLVLGDMKELGRDEKALHHLAGKSIRNAGIDFLFTYGDLAQNTSLAFGEGAYHFNEQNKLLNALRPLLCQQTTILVKGSRSMKMENVVLGLVHNSNIRKQEKM